MQKTSAVPAGRPCTPTCNPQLQFLLPFQRKRSSGKRKHEASGKKGYATYQRRRQWLNLRLPGYRDCLVEVALLVNAFWCVTLLPRWVPGLLICPRSGHLKAFSAAEFVFRACFPWFWCWQHRTHIFLQDFRPLFRCQPKCFDDQHVPTANWARRKNQDILPSELQVTTVIDVDMSCYSYTIYNFPHLHLLCRLSGSAFRLQFCFCFPTVRERESTLFPPVRRNKVLSTL